MRLRRPAGPKRFRTGCDTAAVKRDTPRKQCLAGPFRRVGWRSFGLFGRRIAQTSAGRAHIPEIAANKITLAGVVVQNGRERRIGVRLRLALAVSRAHRTWIRSSRPIDVRHRTGETRFGHVAKSTGFITVHGKVLVVQHQLAEQFDLLDLIFRRRGQPLDRLRLAALDLDFDLSDFALCRGERVPHRCVPLPVHPRSARQNGNRSQDRASRHRGCRGSRHDSRPMRPRHLNLHRSSGREWIDRNIDNMIRPAIKRHRRVTNGPSHAQISRPAFLLRITVMWRLTSPISSAVLALIFCPTACRPSHATRGIRPRP